MDMVKLSCVKLLFFTQFLLQESVCIIKVQVCVKEGVTVTNLLLSCMMELAKCSVWLEYGDGIPSSPLLNSKGFKRPTCA